MNEPMGRASARILFESPATADAFGGRGHERSASALADAIVQLNGRDGAIGIEGSWGSGKSTVISLAEDALRRIDERAKYHVFTFDLWTHQTDDFRRAFLEEFVKWCKISGRISAAEATRFSDQIRDRVKTIRSGSFREYSMVGAIFVLLLPFLPLVYSWVGPAAFKDYKAPVAFGLSLPSLASLMIFAFPVVVILSVIWLARERLLVRPLRLAGRFYGRMWSWQEPKALPDRTGDTLTLAVSKATSLFSRDVKRDTVRQNIRDEDPTTVEFSSVFRRILAAAQKSENRVIIVLDNIDRLSPGAGPVAWSQVRSVFANAPLEHLEGNTAVTAVIPFDRKHTLTELNSGKQSFEIADVLEKTFNRIIKVSPPVAADWHKFHDEGLEYVFEGNVTAEQQYKLFKILELSLRDAKKMPTPRHIIAYINEIGALWTQWAGIIPKESLALYVVHRDGIENDPSSLRKPDLVSARFLFVANQPDWRKHFAALTFNVDVERANQVLLSDDIIRSVQQSEVTEIASIASLPGFEEVLYDVVDDQIDQWAFEDAKLVSSVAANLASLELSTELHASIWRRLAQVVPRLGTLDISLVSTQTGLFSILSKLPYKEAAPVIDQFVGWITTSAGDPTTRGIAKGRAWRRSIHAVLESIDYHSIFGRSGEFAKRYVLPASPDFVIGAALERSAALSFSDFRNVVPALELVEALKSLAAADPNALLAVLPEIKHLIKPAQILELATDIGTLLAVEDMEDEVAYPLLEALGWLQHFGQLDRPVAAAIEALVTDGTVLRRGYAAEEVNARAAAIWLLVGNFGISKLSAIAEKHAVIGTLAEEKEWLAGILGEDEVDDNISAALAKYASKYDRFTNWMRLALGDPTDNGFFGHVFKSIVRAATFDRMVVDETLEKYGGIKANIGEELARKFIVKLGEWNASFADATASKKWRKVPVVLLQDIATSNAKAAFISLLDGIDAGLRNLSKEEWREDLGAGGQGVRLLSARRAMTAISLPSTELSVALIGHITALLTGELAAPMTSADWDELPQSLRPASLKKLAENALKTMSAPGVTVEGIGAFLEVYPSIARTMPLVSYPDIAIDALATKFLTIGSASTRDFLRNHATEFSAALGLASATTKQAFEEAIVGLEEREDQEGRDLAAYARTTLLKSVPKSRGRKSKGSKRN